MAPIRTSALLLIVVIAFALAACGGDNSNNASPASKATTPAAGGAVGAEGTAGLVGPATSVEDGKEAVIGEGGKMTEDLDRPTDAQKNGVAGGAACAASAAANPSASNLTSVTAATICLLNAERSAKGLPPLHLDSKLNTASKLMAGLMVKKRFFSHDTPDGRSVVDRVKPTGYIRGNWSLGENIAWGSGALATPRAIVNGWMHSKGHRENILRAKFKDIGIGVKLGAPGPGLSGGATYVTDFGRHS